MTKVKGLPKKFDTLWRAAEQLLEQAHVKDVLHTKDMIEEVLGCRKILVFNLDVFLPLAILHNIERITVLKEHLNDVRVTVRLKNDKLIRLSPAENVVKSLCQSAGISQANIEEILDILKVRNKASREEHFEIKKRNKLYDTDNKKLFYDLHLLSRFNKKEIKDIEHAISDKDKFKKFIDVRFELFFNSKIKNLAQEKFRQIEGIKKSPVWSEHQSFICAIIHYEGKRKFFIPKEKNSF